MLRAICGSLSCSLARSPKLNLQKEFLPTDDSPFPERRDLPISPQSPHAKRSTRRSRAPLSRSAGIHLSPRNRATRSEAPAAVGLHFRRGAERSGSCVANDAQRPLLF